MSQFQSSAIVHECLTALTTNQGCDQQNKNPKTKEKNESITLEKLKKQRKTI